MPVLSRVTPQKKKDILEHAIGIAEELVFRYCMDLGIDPLGVADSYPVNEESSRAEIMLSKELARLKFLQSQYDQIQE